MEGNYGVEVYLVYFDSYGVVGVNRVFVSDVMSIGIVYKVMVFDVGDGWVGRGEMSVGGVVLKRLVIGLG